MSRKLAFAAMVAAVLALPGSAQAKRHDGKKLHRVKHVVVIYEENHSFDNLYGGWEGVDGLGKADAAHTTQVSQAGQPYECLRQNDVNLTSPPLSPDCTNTTGGAFQSHFTNKPFTIDDYIKPEDTTCPAPGVFAPNGVPKGSGLPGGCTRDLVHRYYEEQYQLNGGAQNRYVTGSDAVGLTMGGYRTRELPIYRYLHSKRHPRYAIADRFFQGAFGGSFLNHQWLVAAATPVFYNAVKDGSDNDLHSIVDSNGMPADNYPLYNPTNPVRNRQLTQACPAPAGVTCGDWAVNTIQPPYQPYAPNTAPEKRLPPQQGATIGDRLSGKGIDWAWYSGGWSNANGDVGAPGWTNGNTPGTCTDTNTAAGATYPNCPDKLFQYHHQPLNYYATFAPGTQMRRQHLRDEVELEGLISGSKKHCELKPVSLLKPIGAENEHPGYASEHTGSDHLVGLLQGIHSSRCAKNTMVIVTYDEFGGQWDHVPPPGQGATTPGPHDRMGPGTRIPALVLAPGLPGKAVVDHASHDTTSIMATIEHRFGLKPISSRDRDVKDLSTVFKSHKKKHSRRGHHGRKTHRGGRKGHGHHGDHGHARLD
jgi:phospholipase C